PDSGVDLDWFYRLTYPGSLSSDELDLYNGPAQLERRIWDDPTTAEFTTEVEADERAGALHVAVTGIPAPEVADVWVLDAEGNKVAESVKLGQADEELAVYPDGGDYRFAPGTTFTVVVYCDDVVVEAPEVQLRVWWDYLNLWLTTDDPAVTVASIEAGQVARAYVHYDKDGWSVGDADLSARVIAGPSVLPMAFDELLTITRVDDPATAAWNPNDLLITLTPASDRGALVGAAYWYLGGEPIPTVLIGPGEVVTYTARVENTSSVRSDDLCVDTWPLPEDYLSTWGYVPATAQVDGVSYTLVSGPGNDYGAGIDWQGQLDPGEVLEFSYAVTMPSDMAVNKNHSAGVDVYLGTDWSGDWLGWALAGAWNRPALFSGDKSADAYYVVGGQELTYTLSFQAVAGQDQAVTITDPLPAEVSFVSANNGATYDSSTRTVRWEGTLPGAVDAPVDIDIVVEVADGLAYESSFTNTAQLARSGGAVIGSVSWECVVDSAAWLEIDKTADKRWALPGQEVEFTIRMGNLGTDPALGVVMTDVLPDGLTLASVPVGASAGNLVRSEDGPSADSLVWLGDIASGEVVTITFTAIVSEHATPGLVLMNGVTATADNFPSTVYDAMPLQVLRNLPTWFAVQMRTARPRRPG
ncbi:MAG: DUF11 domain-containing protein, partial [Anaerolineales bacterium]